MQNVTTATFKLNTGAAIPALGMGTVDFESDEDKAVANLIAGLREGYRLLDTAAVYKNEHVVGRAIRECGLPREQLFITTKLWNTDIREDREEAAFEESLEKLGLDYVDLYLIHWPIKERLVESWKAVEAFYEDGRAKAIGTSNFQPHHFDAILADAKVVPALNQVEFHPIFQQRDLRAYCDKKGILLQGWKPFFGGKILDNPVLTELAGKYDRSVAQIILRWFFETGVATCPKSATPDRIRQNAQIFDFSLAPEDKQRIDALDTNKRLGSDPDNFSF